RLPALPALRQPNGRRFDTERGQHERVGQQADRRMYERAAGDVDGPDEHAGGEEDRAVDEDCPEAWVTPAQPSADQRERGQHRRQREDKETAPPPPQPRRAGSSRVGLLPAPGTPQEWAGY